jgi:hypothetical protein
MLPSNIINIFLPLYLVSKYGFLKMRYGTTYSPGKKSLVRASITKSQSLLTPLDSSREEAASFQFVTWMSKIFRWHPLLIFRKVRSSEDLIDKKLALYIYLDENGRSKGFIYLTDGISTYYQQGEHSLHEVEFDGKDLRSNQKLGKNFDISKRIGAMEFFAWWFIEHWWFIRSQASKQACS